MPKQIEKARILPDVRLAYIVATKGQKPASYQAVKLAGALVALAQTKREADAAAKAAREAFDAGVAKMAHDAKRLPDDVVPAIYWSRFSGEPQIGLDAAGNVLVRKPADHKPDAPEGVNLF